MAVIQTTRPMKSTAGAGFFTGLAARFFAWNDARLTRRALGALSDHELNDIGLGRGDIDDVAAGTYR